MNRIVFLDVAKVICMTWIVAVLHLLQYIGGGYSLYSQPWGYNITWACLGTFSFIAGFLMGNKSCSSFRDVVSFYKKRLLRFYILLVFSSLLLVLIGFITIRQALFGLSGLSPFVLDQPRTLWYISMLMIFYLITPLVLNRRRIVVSVLIMACLIVYRMRFIVDDRFVYNCLLYLTGVCIAPHWEFFEKQLSKPLYAVVFTLLYVAVLLISSYMPNHRVVQFASLLGIPCILCLSQQIAGFGELKIISLLSYASLSCYLFHRFIYWGVLQVYTPQNKLFLFLYMIFVGYLLTVVLSYFIQKAYDLFCAKFVK